MRINLYRLRAQFKGLLFVLAVGIILFLLFYNYKTVNDLRAESRQVLLFYAKLYASAASTESASNLDFIFDEIIQRTNFPIVLTDSERQPTGWKGIDVEPDNRSPEALAKVERIMKVMETEATPIALTYEEYSLGYLYYGDSRLILQLQYLPYFGLLIVGLFILIGFFGFRSIQRSEQQFIWVGMSKETAHQIGTPLSSIMGWIEILKSRTRNENSLETIAEMEKDVERLTKITARFSQIGSKANLRETRVVDVLTDVTGYFEKRLPQWGKRVNIVEKYKVKPQVALNRDLFEWVIENLLKNGLDALEKNEGKIEIKLGELKSGRHSIYIDITDNGRGIEASKKKDIFKPGFSTKKRGWGLGLSLAKRIVEDYHGGKLFVKESKLEQGTTMRIIL